MSKEPICQIQTDNLTHASILKQTGVEVHAGEFAILSVSLEDWTRMLQQFAKPERRAAVHDLRKRTE